MTSDYYHIVVDRYILQVQGFQTQYQQACYSSGGTSPICALIVRPSYTNTIAATNLVTACAHAIHQHRLTRVPRGDDLEMNYTGKAFDVTYNLRLLASYQPHHHLQGAWQRYLRSGRRHERADSLYRESLVARDWAGAVGVTDQFTFRLDERWRNPLKMTGN